MADSDLVARAKAGDGGAVAALYDRYAAPLFRYALARVGEPAEAEDVMQRVFLQMIEALPRYEERGLPFGAWLFRIARNTIVDGARARRPVGSLEALTDEPAVADEAGVLLEQAADRATLQAALDQLTAEQREVILYRFFGGLAPEEIARLMGKQAGSIRALQFRGLEAMRRALGVGERPPDASRPSELPASRDATKRTAGSGPS